MAWLVTHMWMVLAGATVFALILGWSVRGMMLTGRMRKAIVDKDVALTELDQARDEIERLFAAQRAQRGEGGSVADASARKISDLTAELQKAKTELATLKSDVANAGADAPAAPAAERDMPTIVLPPNRGSADDASGETGAAESLAGGDAPEAPTLVWRNRHLEARVQHLEAQLAELETAPAAEQVSDAEPEPVVEDTSVAAAVPSVDEEGLSKLKWQADYLKQRVEALEAELAKVPAEAPAASEEDTNEEMARLRWRNRFLEGRLAYFEGGAEEATAETDPEKTGAEAILEQLEVTDTAADMTEAVEAMAEQVSAVEMPGEDASPEEGELEGFEAEDVIEDEDDVGEEEAAFEELPEMDVADEEDTAEVEEVRTEEAGVEEAPEAASEPQDDRFEDIPNDEEEALAEADHADEDVLSDEEYDADDFVEDDEDEAEDDDEAEAVYDETSDETDEESEDDAFDDEAFDDDDFEDDTDEDDAGDDDFEEEDDEEAETYEAYDDADEEDDSEDMSDADIEDESDDAEPELEDAGDAADFADDSDDVDEAEAVDDNEVSGEPEGSVPTERPMAMNGPVEGHPDDLTLIGGIGPKIQILLNELGVWHYDQIAEWTPENVAWVDEHLNFNGRITREGWVEQAAVLVRDAESV